MRTIFALIAFLLSGGEVALAQSQPPPVDPQEIIEYHDSGAWAADTSSVIRRARRQVRRHSDDDRPAIVLDIDDTSLSNYHCLKAVNFDRAAASCGEEGDLPAIPQTRRLYRYARRLGVTVFFITGRRARLRETTTKNLRAAGYTGRLRVRLRPDRQPASARDGWKARTRRSIQRRGYTIVANIGDQHSDLDGGQALRRFKIPNPMYVIPEA